ncbi:MAG: hypothetical protein AB1Z66_03415 [Candidatus Limnocylindrales bacterium]
MRTRLALSTTIAGGLLLASTLGAAAQDGQPATLVTGSVTYPEGCEDTPEYTECPGFGFEASDPRLTADGVVRIDMVDSDGADPVEFAVAVGQSMRLENPDGAWSGTGTNVAVFGNDGKLLDRSTIVLTGEGGYDGLTAVIFGDGEAEAFEALIYGGEMPVAPPVPTE